MGINQKCTKLEVWRPRDFNFSEYYFSIILIKEAEFMQVHLRRCCSVTCTYTLQVYWGQHPLEATPPTCDVVPPSFAQVISRILDYWGHMFEPGPLDYWRHMFEPVDNMEWVTLQRIHNARLPIQVRHLKCIWWVANESFWCQYISAWLSKQLIYLNLPRYNGVCWHE